MSTDLHWHLACRVLYNDSGQHSDYFFSKFSKYYFLPARHHIVHTLQKGDTSINE